MRGGPTVEAASNNSGLISRWRVLRDEAREKGAYQSLGVSRKKENATIDSSDPVGHYLLDNVKYIPSVYLSVALSVVSLLGTVGNGLVIWFVVFKMKKTVSSIWFLSLALADFTFSLFLPLQVTNQALSNHWPFGDFMCKLDSFVSPLNVLSSVLQLTVISIDRCACVVFPVWCQNHRTTRLAWKITLLIWALAAFCSVSFFVLKRTITSADGQIICYETWIPSLNEQKVINGFIFFFVAPLIIIVSCYTVIIVRMRRYRMVTSTKPFRMIAAIIICFFICWLPYHVFSIMLMSAVYSNNTYLIDVFLIGSGIAVSLGFANSCINPFLYVFFGRDFKEKFCGSIQSALRRGLTEEPDWRYPQRNTDQGRDSVCHDIGIPMAAQNVEIS
ncbi:formyl peptide receptor-related sequence 4-like [Gastrophryne carolinensis]